MKKLLFFFMALLMIGAACTGAAGISGGSVSRDAIPVMTAGFREEAAIHDVFFMAPAVLELRETPGDIFDVTSGFHGESPAVAKEVIPFTGYSEPAVHKTSV